MKKYYLVVLAAFALSACASNSSGTSSSASPVFNLLEKGKTKEAQALFTGKVSLDERDARGRTALHAAAETGNAEMVRFLLAMGAEVDPLDNEGRTPLGIAVTRTDPGVSRLLTAAGADIHVPVNSSTTSSCVLLAVRSGGALLEAVIQPQTLNSRGAGGLTMAHLAALEGHAGSARIIAASGALLNEKDDSGRTPLDYAYNGTAQVEHAETAEQLILAGAASGNPFHSYFAPAVRSSNYNIRIADGYTSLHYAAREGYVGYLAFILDKRADVNIKNNSGAAPLHEASRFGRLDAMAFLIKHGADVNAQDAKGNSALHLAAPVEQHREAVGLLTSAGANPNLRDEHGDTPLHVVITLGRQADIVETLLENGAEVTGRNIEGKTALFLTVENKRTDLVPALLERGADIFAADNKGTTPLEAALKERDSAVLDAILTEETVLESDSAGNTPLHIAVKNRAGADIVEMILNKHGAVNARNKEGNTALHIANIIDYETAGTLLIARGADLFAVNSKGENPFYLAFHSPGNVREWMLTEKTLALRDGLGNTALHYASQWKLAAHVPLLVRKGAQLEAANATGETPLFIAARANSPETISALLAAGALINARDFQGNSPLHAAVLWNAENSIDPLIKAGNSVNAQNLAGKSPLHETVRLGLTPTEALLINRQADIEIRDNMGNTPLMEAVQGGFPGAVERLAESGADIVTRNNSGDTPLHIAVTMQRPDLVTLLLSNGAPIHARNSRGITPFQIALGISPAMTATLLTKDRISMVDDNGLSPLHIAVKQRVPAETLRAIINRGCRVSTVDSEGRTPLRLALDMSALEEAKILSDAGSNVFSPAADGKTPASVALVRGEGAVRALFSGTAINARDSTGNTILHYAAQNGRTDMIGVLLELGADKNLRNVSAESPADIALRWNHSQAAALLR